MNTHQPATDQLAQNTNSTENALSQSALDQSSEGASMSPPAFQLKANKSPSNEAPIQAKLKFTGEAAAMNKGVQLLNKHLFGAKVEMDKIGELSLKKVADMGPMTEQQNHLYNYLDKLINDPKTTSVRMEGESNIVTGGSYQNSTVDINDILALGNKGGMTSIGVMIHELVEQYHKQVRGWPYGNSMVGAHYHGVKAENDVNGTIRGEEKIVSSTRNKDGSVSAKVTVEYKRPGGKKVITTLTITANKIVSAVHKEVNTAGNATSQPSSQPSSQPASKPTSKPASR